VAQEIADGAHQLANYPDEIGDDAAETA